jgi:hypothetical protein
MLATAQPYCGDKPDLVIIEPQHRPGDDGVGDEERRLPLAIVRMMKTKDLTRI